MMLQKDDLLAPTQPPMTLAGAAVFAAIIAVSVLGLGLSVIL